MTPPHIPNDGTLDGAAVAIRELFESYMRAGFTEWQACIIVGVQLATFGKGNIDGGGDA